MVPNGWVESPLKDLVQKDRPIRYGVVQPGEIVPDGVKFLRGGDIQSGKISSDLRTISREVSRQYPKTLLNGGELLVALVGYVGESALVSSDLKGANIARQVGLIALGPKVDHQFVQQFLQSPTGRGRLLRPTIGSAQQVINIGDLKEVNVLLPPLPEQHKIAAILSTWDRAIELTEKLIAAKQRRKQALMQRLLTGKVRLGGGDAKWATKKLGDLLAEKPRYGINAAACDFSEDLPRYLRITDITEDGYYTSEKQVSVDSPDSGNYFLCDGDVVVARTGASVGKSYLYRASDGPMVYAGFLIKLTPDPTKLRPLFLSAFMKTTQYWEWIATMSQRSGQPGVNGKEYSLLTITIPTTIKEQEEIEEVIQCAEKELQTLKVRAKTMQRQKRGLMQQLLTGKVRVNLPHSKSQS